MSESNYPLYWPHGWPRATTRHWSKFGPRQKGAPMGAALDYLMAELTRLGATSSVISTNVQARLDGRPFGNAGRMFSVFERIEAKS